MPKMKVPRKSTSIDMTAMCDVAFLLLSFFIFTAKFKKSEEVAIVTPNSVATDSVSLKNKFNIYCNITPGENSKVLIGFETDSIARLVAMDMNKYKSLGLSDAEVEAFSKKTSTGADFKNMKTYFGLVGTPQAPKEPEGIPVMDSTDNQLKDWIDISDRIYQAGKANNPELSRTIYIKADKTSRYDVVDRVMETFAKKGLDQFKLVTTPEDVPMGTALYEKRKRGL